MNWILKLLGYRDREYCGSEFSVRIKPMMREVVSLIYTRKRIALSLSGERIGRKWEGIEVYIPPEVEDAQIPQIVGDLKEAFEAIRYGYVIVRKTGVDIVPESDRHAAIAELSEMGYEIKILPDRQIRLTRRDGAPRHDIETIRRTTPRMMALLQSVHGTRQRFEPLAKSKEF